MISVKPKVFVSHWMPQIGIDILRERCEVDYYDGTEPLGKERLIERARDAEGMLAFVCDYIDEDVVRSCPRLRVISSFGKGADNIAIEACTRRGVLVTVNRDALTESTADLAIGLLLAVSRNIAAGDRHVRARQFGGWHAAILLGRDFHHSRLGIVGFGAIGQAIARRARGFDVRIAYSDIERKPEAERPLGASYLPLPELLAESDYVVCAVDLRPQNRHLLGREAIARMKPGSYLINISRGSIVDEAAAADALRSGLLAGYAADVFEFEDAIFAQRPAYIDDGLLSSADKTVLTPHLGTGTMQARERLAVSSASQLIAALSGEVPAGAVNAQGRQT